MTPKLKITVVDFLPYFGKYPTEIKDDQGKDVCYGHAVKYRGERWLVMYRYGKAVLKQPYQMYYIGLPPDGMVVTNEVVSCEEYLISGHTTEPFIQQLIADQEAAAV